MERPTARRPKKKKQPLSPPPPRDPAFRLFDESVADDAAADTGRDPAFRLFDESVDTPTTPPRDPAFRLFDESVDDDDAAPTVEPRDPAFLLFDTDNESASDVDAMDIDVPHGTKRSYEHLMDAAMDALSVEPVASEEDDDDDNPTPPTKRARTDTTAAAGTVSSSPRVAVARTLTAGAEFSHGMVQLAPLQRALARQTTAIPRHVMATRPSQNAHTLASPTVRPLGALLAEYGTWRNAAQPLEALRQQYAVDAFARTELIRVDPSATAAQRQAANVMSATTPAQLASALAGPPVVPSLETPHLLSVKKTKQPRSVRLVDPALGPIFATTTAAPDAASYAAATADTGNLRPPKKVVTQYHFRHENRASRLAYYETDDAEPDPHLPFGLPPRAYPSYAGFAAKRAAFAHRRERLRDQTEATARVEIEELSREYADAYRRPCSAFPRDERRVECSNGEDCQVIAFARRSEGKAHMGYCPPVFFTPSVEQEMRVAMQGDHHAEWMAAHHGPCIECTLYNWTTRVLMAGLSRKPPQHPINTFCVPVGPGQYGRDVLLPPVIENVRTGIEFHVPVWDDAYREFEQLPDKSYVLREVNVDFHRSLSQMDACLGVRKSRPLANVHGRRHATSLPMVGVLSDAPAASLTPSAGSSEVNNNSPVLLLWKRYAQSLSMPMLSDRTLDPSMLTGLPKATSAASSRVPAIWLRHQVLHPDYASLSSSSPPRLSDAARRGFTRHCPLHRVAEYAQWFQTPVAALETTFATLAAGALGVFEHSLLFVTRWVPTAPLLVTPLTIYMRADPVANARLARPPGWTPETAFTGTWIVYSTIMWRIAVAHLLVAALRPWKSEPNAPFHKRRFVYRAHLYVSTHLDVLTCFDAVVGRETGDGGDDDDAGCDRWFLRVPDDDDDNKSGGEARFAAVYPQATRVVCGEELPDLTPMFYGINQFHDLSGKKQRGSLFYTLAQIFIKTNPHVCQMRGANTITDAAMKQYPAVQHLISLVMRCSLLGNFEASDGRPSLYASIKINGAFAPASAFVPRAAVNAAADAAHAVAIRQWVRGHPMLVLSLLREYTLYSTEASGVIDHVRGQTRKWLMFKAVVRFGNTQVRRAVNTMLVTTGRVDWDVLERRENDTTSKGEVVKWHEKEKDHNTKLFKDSDLAIMLKKMTQIGKPLTDAERANVSKKMKTVGKPMTDEESASVLDWMHADGRLEAVHVAAWSAALTASEPFEDGTLRPAIVTGVLKLLGMSMPSYAMLRTWLHASVTYHTSDDNFSSVAQFIYDTDVRDFMLLKLYLRLVDHYNDDVLGFTSVNQMRTQLVAQRRSLGVPAHTSTPPTLGLTYFCEGCGKWAHSIVRPSREYQGMPHQTDRHRSRLRAATTTTTTTPAIPAVGGGAVKRGNKRKKPPPPRPWPSRAFHLTDGRVGCMRSVAFDPLTGRLHCVRASTVESSTVTATAAAAVPHVTGASDEDDADVDEDDDMDIDAEDDDDDDDASESTSDSDDDDDDDDDEDDDEGTAVSTSGRNNSKKIDPTGALTRTLMSLFNCREPLMAVDLSGCCKRQRKHLYQRCCYCGRPCEVIAANMTNSGLSCGEHAFPDEYPEWHSIWRHLQLPAKPVQPHQGLLPRSCYACGHYDREGTVEQWAYDETCRLVCLTLCRYHATLARPALPQVSHGERPAPVRLTRLLPLLRST